MNRNRNLLFLAVGALVVAILVIGYLLYQDRQTTGIEIKIGEDGVSIEGK